MTNPVQEVNRLGQSIWYDNIRRGMIRSGELQQLIDLGITGVTSNPTIFEKAIAGSTDYDETLGLFGWLGRVCVRYGTSVKIMYRVDGEAHPVKEELTHLESYKQSSPVRIGNGESDQVQHDISRHLWRGVGKHSSN